MGVEIEKASRNEADPVRPTDERESSVRSGVTEIRDWILVSGNRWILTSLSLTVVGLGFLGFGALWTDEFVTLFTEAAVVQALLITFLSGIILLVSIAVSINAVVLSQEITALGEQEEQIDETFSFRDDVREATDASVSPARPAEFLRIVLDAIRTDAEILRASEGDATTDIGDTVTIVTDDIIRQVDAVTGRLERGSFGTSEVLLAGMDYDYSWQVYALRRLQVEHSDVLSEDVLEQIEELLSVLKYFSIGREYFKTLYFKRELANLSRALLVVAFPSIVVLSFTLLAIRAGVVPALSVLGVPSIVLVVGFAYILGLAPYTLFSAYVLRSATITSETLAAGPFILDGNDKRGQIDWESGPVTDDD